MTYEFHTEQVDDEEICGILGVPRKRKIFEFINPKEHSDYARWKCPATGETVQWDTIINEAMAMEQGAIKAQVSAAEWAEIRQDYIDKVDDENLIDADLLDEWLDQMA